MDKIITISGYWKTFRIIGCIEELPMHRGLKYMGIIGGEHSYQASESAFYFLKGRGYAFKRD